MTDCPEPTFRAIAESAHGVEAWFDLSGRLHWVSPSIERVSGYTPGECIAENDLVALLIYHKDRNYVLDLAQRAATEASPGSAEVRFKRKDGSLIWVAVFWRPLAGEGAISGVRVSAIEIQSRKEAEMQLLNTVAELRRVRALQDHFLTRSNEERARLEALLNVMKVGVLFMDNDRRVLFCNKPFQRIWGMNESDSLTGVREAILLECTAALRSDDEVYRHHIRRVTASERISDPNECEFTDGRVIRDISAPVPGPVAGRFIGRVWIYEDVTEEKRIRARLIELAERDPLTGLYNRRRFIEELDRMIADATRKHSQVGLIALDLDGFKPVNDRFGHQAGDLVLTTVAREVGAVVRRNEIFFRIGGDEFAILAPDVEEESLVKLARRVCTRISHLHFEFGGREALITASIGIAVYPHHAGNALELISRGDRAMYGAKAEGKNTWRVFDPSMLYAAGL